MLVRAPLATNRHRGCQPRRRDVRSCNLLPRPTRLLVVQLVAAVVAAASAPRAVASRPKRLVHALLSAWAEEERRWAHDLTACALADIANHFNFVIHPAAQKPQHMLPHRAHPLRPTHP